MPIRLKQKTREEMIQEYTDRVFKVDDVDKLDEQSQRMCRALQLISSGDFSGHGFGGSRCKSIAEYALESIPARIAREARLALQGKVNKEGDWDIDTRQKKFVDGEISLVEYYTY